MSPSRFLFVLPAVAVLACQGEVKQETEDTLTSDTGATAMNASEDTPAQGGQDKVANAMSAAPKEIAQNATIMDWPAKEGGEPTQLRAGTNDWVCYPSTPVTAGAPGEDPMCLDKQFAVLGAAWMSKQKPQIKGMGIGYMLQGDRGVSNTDPYAKGPTDDNQWVRTGPHLMIVMPDRAMLAGIPTDPKTGGPWVMWKGTPYAHVMVPVQ